MANLLVEGRCKLVLNLEGVGPTEFIGISKAACGTSIAIPRLSLQLDAGNNVYNYHPDAVFMTHCHSDHCYRATHFVSRDKPPLFFMPLSMVDRLEDYLFASQKLSLNRNMTIEQYACGHINRGISVGDVITDFCKNKQIGAHVVECSHSVPCCGYAFFIRKQKRMAKYADATNSELKEMKTAGVNITECIDLPMFMFLGDTDYNAFNENNPDNVLSYIKRGWKNIFIECSFLELEMLEKAHDKKHMHWFDLKKIVSAYPDVSFILMHFSARYKYNDIVNFFQGEGFTNIKLFIAPEYEVVPDAVCIL